MDQKNQPTTEQVRTLNDKLRRELFWLPKPHRLVVTPEVSAMSIERQQHLLEQFMQFEDFNADNDPHGEHDFISLDCGGQTWFMKIDYYDKDLQFFDNTENGVRVFTIMHASEY